MSSSLAVEQAFAQRPDLKRRVQDISGKTPELRNLLEDVAQYINQIISPETVAANETEPFSKKRKLETQATAEWDKGTYQAFNDISLSIPLRKKLRLEIGKKPKQGIRAIGAGGETEAQTSWAAITNVLCLPVPEKAQAQYNFCVFSAIRDDTAAEQILWTVPEAAPKGLGSEIRLQDGDTYRTLMLSTINEALKTRKRVVEPNDQEFAGQVVQGHRKAERAYHVKAFRGAKEGYLFFLSIGILWGFKKPLELYLFDSIDSVSYTSVLQRTFNLNVASRASADAEPQEVEFSMVDQADFAGIDAYIKRHGLQDASMAEQRRAKKLNVNGAKGDDAGQDGYEEGGELEKAQRQVEELEDEEDEEDENFNPGSDGESEGSGTSSDEDDDMADGDAGSGDLVEEELGSEAEELDD